MSTNTLFSIFTWKTPGDVTFLMLLTLVIHVSGTCDVMLHPIGLRGHAPELECFVWYFCSAPTMRSLHCSTKKGGNRLLVDPTRPADNDMMVSYLRIEDSSGPRTVDFSRDQKTLSPKLYCTGFHCLAPYM